ncbi:hypothetical protein [Halocatena halophila]|uniref:hypothetical protein n=1 Tax=Halocatena halophila TaxID=2814576 RepID=UPI002ED1D3C5
MDSNISQTQVVVITVVTIILVGLVVSPVAGASEEESEPNDAPGATTLISGSSIDGKISTEGDEDWVGKKYDSGEKVTFTVAKPLWNHGLKVSLHGPNGSQLDNTTVRKGVDIATVSVTAKNAGFHAVRIQGIGPDRQGANYTVHTDPDKQQDPTKVSLPSGMVRDSEPNNGSFDAQKVDKKSVSGAINDNKDRDVYAIQVTEGEKVSILIENINNENWVKYEMYSPADLDGHRSEIAEGEFDDDPRSQVVVTPERSGTMLVKMRGTINKNLVKYKIDVSYPGRTSTPSDDKQSNGQSDESGDTENSSTDSEMTKLFGPGFTGPAAILALLLTGLFGWRRT